MAHIAADALWWEAVKAMAEFVISGHEVFDLGSDYTHQHLKELGFSHADINKAHDWIDRAALSGALTESLAMLQPHVQMDRYPSELERTYLSEYIWEGIERARRKGWVTDEAMEHLIEGVRVVDTRGWEDEDVAGLIYELFSMLLPETAERIYHMLLCDNSEDLLS